MEETKSILKQFTTTETKTCGHCIHRKVCRFERQATAFGLEVNLGEICKYAEKVCLTEEKTK